MKIFQRILAGACFTGRIKQHAYGQGRRKFLRRMTGTGRQWLRGSQTHPLTSLSLCIFTWHVREKDKTAFQAKIKCLMDIFPKLFSSFPNLLQVKTTYQQMLNNLLRNTHQNTRQHTKAFYRIMDKNKTYWVKFQSSQGKRLLH